MMGTIPATTRGGRNMIKLVESFDHIGSAAGGISTDLSLYTGLGWEWGLPEYGIYTLAAIVAGEGRFGTNALNILPVYYGGEKWFAPPLIQRKGKKLVFGFSMKGCGTVRAVFKYNTHSNFTMTCTFDSTVFGVFLGTLTVAMQTGGTDPYIDDTRWAGYPAIATDEKIPIPYGDTDYHFIELFLDVTSYKNGRAKIAVDGRTYYDKQGIVTTAYNTFGDNPYDDRANINGVKLIVTPVAGPTYMNDQMRIYPFIDSVYMADDQGGYQDDFLGDIFVKAAYPVADGTKRNWVPYANATVLAPETAHHALLDNNPIQPGDETKYVEADQDMTEDMLGFGVDPIPAGSDLIAVNHRTMYRNVASPGTPKLNSLTPLFQMLGNPIVRTDSLAQRLAGWAYGFLDVYYPIVPVSAEQWREYLLEQAEFGFMLKTSENHQKVEEAVALADEVMVE
jgi:hypothetical protein